MVLVFMLTMVFGNTVENMTTCSNKCDSGCRTYMIPLETCFSPAKLFPGDDTWGAGDVYDKCEGKSLDRTFYDSTNGTCVGHDGGFTIPLNACVGPFGKPRPWGTFTCSSSSGAGGRSATPADTNSVGREAISWTADTRSDAATSTHLQGKKGGGSVTLQGFKLELDLEQAKAVERGDRLSTVDS
eukprot:gene19101-322_t